MANNPEQSNNYLTEQGIIFQCKNNPDVLVYLNHIETGPKVVGEYHLKRPV